MALRQVCGAGISPAWFNHNILGRRDAHTTIILKPGGEPKSFFSSLGRPTCVMIPQLGILTFNHWTATSRQLKPGDVKSIKQTGNAEMAEGTIKKLTDKGFGFINTGKEKDLFFHSSSLQGVSFEELREGQKVSYTEGRGPKGPCAENVTPV